MGCDIHSFAEKKEGERYVAIDLHPFDERCYDTFAFLAGVRNYSGLQPLVEPRDIPADVSDEVREEYEGWSTDAHTPSWLSVSELEAFNYDADMEDRRATRPVGPNSWDGGCTCDPGEGKRMTWRELLGEGFFRDLAALKEAGADRVVFWFES